MRSPAHWLENWQRSGAMNARALSVALPPSIHGALSQHFCHLRRVCPMVRCQSSDATRLGFGVRNPPMKAHYRWCCGSARQLSVGISAGRPPQRMGTDYAGTNPREYFADEGEVEAARLSRLEKPRCFGDDSTYANAPLCTYLFAFLVGLWFGIDGLIAPTPAALRL